MTAQINDTCFHRKIKFAIASSSGSGLFDPSDFGFSPNPLCTACGRGFFASYKIRDDRLFLTSFNIGSDGNIFNDHRVKRIMLEVFDIAPTSTGLLGDVYEGLRIPWPFTGTLFLGEKLVRRVDFPMNQHPASGFSHVRELVFQAGRISEEHDRSAEMAAQRAKADLEMESFTFEVIASTHPRDEGRARTLSEC